MRDLEFHPGVLPKIHDFKRIPHSFSWDPAYGLSLADLYARSRPELRLEAQGWAEPADFAEFWEGTFAEQAKLPPEILERRPSAEQGRAPASYRVEEIYFQVLDGWRVGAWLVTPRAADRLEHLAVVGHGYGGRAEIGTEFLDGRHALLYVCAPGFNLSADPKRVVPGSSAFHVINGIENPRTYILRACVAAHWAAGRILQALYPGLPLIYDGTSFGGGLGTMNLAWGNVFSGGYLGQPTFANHPFRLRNETCGSAASVRALWLRADATKRAAIENTLRYYEGVFHARRIRVPVAFCLSVFDPAVPAAGQFTLALSVPRGLRRIAPTTTGHYDVPHPLLELEQRRIQRVREWLWRRVALARQAAAQSA